MVEFFSGIYLRFRFKVLNGRCFNNCEELRSINYIFSFDLLEGEREDGG